MAEVWDEDQQGAENRGKREIRAAAVEGAGQPHLHAKSPCKEIVAAVGRASWAGLSPLSIKGPTQGWRVGDLLVSSGAAHISNLTIWEAEVAGRRFPDPCSSIYRGRLCS